MNLSVTGASLALPLPVDAKASTRTCRCDAVVQRSNFCLVDAAGRCWALFPGRAKSAPAPKESRVHWHCPREPWITVKGEHRGQTIALQELHEGVQSRFCREILANYGMKPDGGTCIDKITSFHHVLPLAQRLSRHRRVIFEIHLNLLQGFGPLQWLGYAPTIDGDTVVLPQNLPDSPG
jgi:hypothetical protein